MIHQSELDMQRGAGIGQVFTNIFRRLLPLAKSLFSVGKQAAKTSTGQRVLKVARDSAFQAGLNVANDALQGEKVTKALRKRTKEAGQKVIQSALERGRGGTKRRAVSKGATAPKRSKKKGHSTVLLKDWGL